MKVSDILTPLYQEANQQASTLLIWDIWMYNAIDMALCDIYSYEWNNWDFMYKTQEFIFNSWDPISKDFTTLENITRIAWVFNLDWTIPVPYKFVVAWSKYHLDAANLSKASSQYTIQQSIPKNEIPISFKSLWNNVTLNQAWWMKQAVCYYGWYTAPTKLDDVIPVPDAFKSCLRDLALHYIIWPQWQYWEQKSWDLFNRWHIKLQHLAKSWLKQISNISFK